MINNLNRGLDKIINSNIGIIFIKGFIILLLIAFVIQIVKGLLNGIKSTISYSKIKFNKILKKNSDVISTNESFLAAPLFSKEDFFMEGRSFFKIKQYERYYTLLKSGVILILHPRYIKTFFHNCIYIEDMLDKRILGDLVVSLKSISILPSKLSCVDILIKNNGKKYIELNMPKGQKKDWFLIYLNLKNTERKIVAIDKISNEDFMLSGRIDSGETVNVTLFFETIPHKILRNADSIEVSGFLKFRGKQKHMEYNIKADNINQQNSDYYKIIKNTFSKEDLFRILKQGGFMYIACVLILLMLALIMICSSIIFKIFLCIISILLFVLASRMNIVFTQYIYDIMVNNKDI